MPKNYLLIYSEQLATEIELLCQNIKAPSNTLFQIRKSSSSIYANIREANYGQSKGDMVSKFEIALKECMIAAAESKGPPPCFRKYGNKEVIYMQKAKSQTNIKMICLAGVIFSEFF